MRIIKQGEVFKVQELRKFLWFKPHWKTIQYEDVANDGAGSSYEDYKFRTIEEAKQFIDEWRGVPKKFEIICEY